MPIAPCRMYSISLSENSGADTIFIDACKDSASTSMPFIRANTSTIADISFLLTNLLSLLKPTSKVVPTSHLQLPKPNNFITSFDTNTINQNNNYNKSARQLKDILTQSAFLGKIFAMIYSSVSGSYPDFIFNLKNFFFNTDGPNYIQFFFNPD